MSEDELIEKIAEYKKAISFAKDHNEHHQMLKTMLQESLIKFQDDLIKIQQKEKDETLSTR